jgi:hypothetical protein
MDNSFGIGQFIALEEEVLTRLESLEPLHPVVEEIDPHTTMR